MAGEITVEDAGYVMYAEMLDRLHARFPDVPLWRLEQIAAAENDAITGGLLRIVPAEVEAGTIEMLERERSRASEEGEVA